MLWILPFWGSLISKCPNCRFPNFQKSGLGPAWPHFGPTPAGTQLGPTALGPPGASLEPLCAQLGPSLDPAWAQLTWAQLGSKALGLAWAHLGSTALGLAWVQLGPNLNPAGAQLEPSLNPAWAQESLGPSLGPTLGPAWVHFGPSFGRCEPTLKSAWAQLGAAWDPPGKTKKLMKN